MNTFITYRFGLTPHLLPTFFAVLGAAALIAQAQAQTPEADDPFIWLEEVSSPRAMAWVESHNAVSTKRLEADARYARNYAGALEIAGAKDRIPEPAFIGGEIYNFWQDRDHLRGFWRKTTLADYVSAEPHWTTVLDIDALNKAEGRSWVFKGADVLRPDETRCVILLSDGGEDAVVAREFDLETGKFVDGGFNLPRGKHRIAWEDKDTLLIAAEWMPGELTASGYPFIVKRLKRGQALSEAVEVFRGSKDDGGYGVSPAVFHDGPDRKLAVISRPLDTFHSEEYVLTERGVEQLKIPAKTQVIDLVNGRVILRLNEAWAVGGKTFEAGSLVQTELAAT
jgi:prolyl oligopeptidase